MLDKMTIAQLLFQSCDRYNESIERELNVNLIEVCDIHITTICDGEQIVCIYAEYYDNVDKIDYCGSFYFRVSTSQCVYSMGDKLSRIPVVEVDFLNVLDVH